MTIGEQIRKAREEKGIKQGFLATKLGVTGTYLSSIEKGHKEPSKTLSLLIERVLECKLTL